MFGWTAGSSIGHIAEYESLTSVSWLSLIILLSVLLTHTKRKSLFPSELRERWVTHVSLPQVVGHLHPSQGVFHLLPLLCMIPVCGWYWNVLLHIDLYCWLLWENVPEFLSITFCTLPSAIWCPLDMYSSSSQGFLLVDKKDGVSYNLGSVDKFITRPDGTYRWRGWPR